MNLQIGEGINILELVQVHLIVHVVLKENLLKSLTLRSTTVLILM